jgi:hypothetical protein
MNIEGLTLGAVVLLVLKEVAGLFVDKHKDNTKALENATHAIIKLQTELEFIHKFLERVPEIEKDLNEAHKKLREIKTKLDGSLS